MQIFQRSRIAKIALILVVIFGGWMIVTQFTGNKSQPQYQTAQAQNGTLVVSVSASGQVSTANSASVTTQTSGVVNKIYVKNGDQVKSGAPIADVTLDMDGQQRATQALAAYQNAKNTLTSANNNLYALQSTMFSKWKTYTDIAQNSTYQNADGSPNTTNRILTPFTTSQDDWLAAEAQYKVQQNIIAQAQTAVNSAWASYQQASPTIYAPISGTISGLSLQIGSILTAQTTSTGNSTAQRIANIKTQATPVAVVNLSEIDAPYVKIDDKVTLTMDAFPNKTFTGKVTSIDTTGTVTSGVTTYPAYIAFDAAFDGIYPNMAVDAKIITLVKNNVILVPNAAIQTANNQSSQTGPTVRLLKQGKVTSVSVEVGAANDSQTEIISGASDGDTVVTGILQPSKSGQVTGTSPFSALGRGFGGGGGGALFRAGGR